ncbi:sugar ABC transporter substrate-binding protein [Actinoallomurus sp. NPDC050550]|uniref:ABC transporter substrate-binding protein n=1 Tax=Actinoallomurus sp. NPDC050550 TaxID=3154937 RepID=UPI0033FA1B91
MTYGRRRLLLSGIAMAASLALGASGCGSSGSDSKSDSSGKSAAVSDADVQAALNAGGSITVWAWEPTLKQVVTAFQTKYPKVKVNLVNAGTSKDQYTALQNAISAGKGIPDVAQIEYFAVPQFALGKSLQDLTGFGADKLSGTFSPGPWSSVHQGKGIYGLPMDSGPMALFYNKEVFDKYKINVPTTWDEYVQAAEKLHAADPKAYITNDVGDAGFTTSMIWQAGGKPYKVDGTNVSVNFSDAGSQKFTTTWQQLVSKKLVAPVEGWSDAWFKGLGDGTIASLTTGAWMPANFETGVKAGKGKWRVAPMPQWQAGGTATAENGGSSLAVTAASKQQKLAYGFLKFANVDDGVKLRVDAGAFPATTATLQSPDFLNATPAYFGGQKINEILAQSAKNVVPGWSYLPFQTYANSIFNDTAGKAYISGTTLQQGLQAWQAASIKYGQQQGFTMN